MSAYQGWLLKIGDYVIDQSRFIAAESYQPAVNMQDVDPWTDANGYVHRNAVELREYFTRVEERAKEMVINRSQLSPQMQMVMSLAESMARQELEQKRQAEKVNRIEQTVSNMKDIFTKPIGDWKSEINGRIREISVKSGIGYQTLYGQLYGD